jgi:hypothetical protein
LAYTFKESIKYKKATSANIKHCNTGVSRRVFFKGALIILVTIAMFCTQIGYPAQSKAIPLLVRKEKLLVKYNGIKAIIATMIPLIEFIITSVP